MFSEKTVFVIGAGASKEAGLPLGADLIKRIGNDLDINYDSGGRRKTGAPQIVAALQKKGGVNAFLPSARLITQAVPLATSIDRFIEDHAENPGVRHCGKLAIAHAILESEKSSLLQPNRDNVKTPVDMEKLENTWYIRLFKILQSRVNKSKIYDIFNNVSFIVFNYDRCLEHFLMHAVDYYYGVGEQEAADVVKQAKILHPYGSLGALPWQGQRDQLPFAFDRCEGQNLLAMAERIRTFGEQIAERTTINAIRAEIASAATIVFLGFSFHEDNLLLLAPQDRRTVARIIATTYGIPTAHLSGHIGRIKKAVEGPTTSQLIFEPTYCKDIFDYVDFSIPLQ